MNIFSLAIICIFWIFISWTLRRWAEEKENILHEELERCGRLFDAQSGNHVCASSPWPPTYLNSMYPGPKTTEMCKDLCLAVSKSVRSPIWGHSVFSFNRNYTSILYFIVLLLGILGLSCQHWIQVTMVINTTGNTDAATRLGAQCVLSGPKSS